MDNFPQPLESMLVNLLQSFEVTSWNIKGGMYFTQVNIRFGMEAIGDNTVQHTGYKKMSGAQLKRDSERAKTWRRRYDEDGRRTDHLEQLEVSDHPFEEVSLSETVINTSLSVHDASRNDQQVNLCNISEACQTAPQNNIVQSHMSTKSMCEQEVLKVNKSAEVCDETESDNAIAVAKEGGLKGFTTAMANMDSFDSSDGKSDVSVKVEHLSCDTCFNFVADGSQWYRCTECEEVNICNKCYSQGLHSIHRSQIHEFTAPDDCTQGYCNSCGFKFRPQSVSFFVNQCQACEDYALCKKCMSEGMHQKHAHCFKQIRAKDYVNDIR